MKRGSWQRPPASQEQIDHYIKIRELNMYKRKALYEQRLTGRVETSIRAYAKGLSQLFLGISE